MLIIYYTIQKTIKKSAEEMVNHYRDGIQVILEDFDYSKIIDEYGLDELHTLQKRKSILPLSSIESAQMHISRELTEKIKRLTQREIALMNMQTDVVYYIGHLDDCHGEYITTISTDTEAHISLEVTDCYVSFISEPIRFCMQDTIAHELRHHYDRRMVQLYDAVMEHEKSEEKAESSIDFSFFLMDYLFSVRTEGFASFQPRMRYLDFLDDHAKLYEETRGFLEATEQQWTLSIEPDDETELIDSVLATYEYPRSIHMRPETIYDIGKTVMDTIAFSRTRGRRSITPSLYADVLDEVREMDLFEFYRMYSDALEKVGLSYTTSLIESRYLELLCSDL